MLVSRKTYRKVAKAEAGLAREIEMIEAMKTAAKTELDGYRRLVKRYEIAVRCRDKDAAVTLEVYERPGRLLQTRSFPGGLTGEQLEKRVASLTEFAQKHADLAGAQAALVEVV